MMTEQASHSAKEAKGLQQALKEALKTKDPWDRDVEFQRKNLRQQYLHLLLVHPYAKESKDAETHLWMQTSYAFISIYKQRLAAVERSLQSAPRHQQPQPRQGGPGPVEQRKLIQRFRQFLAEEEKFWTQLIVRFRRSFALDEAQSALIELNILPNTDQSSARNLPDAGDPRNQPVLPTLGRNQLQFPPEDTPIVPLRTPEERQSRLAILSKALVCLGDIARYRELYNEGGGRPKAGHEDAPVARRNGRGRRGGVAESIPRARNYDKAENCYKQAQVLLPQEGNPSHQLAILANYQKDTFGSVFHYYMALCVAQPYDTASENLCTVLSKALEQWRTRARREKERLHVRESEKDGLNSLAPRLRVEAFKGRVVTLHALWRLGVEKMESISPNHAETVLSDFTDLVSERHLPDPTIFETIVLAEGALWKHRMIRDPQNGTGKKFGASISSASSAAIESSITTHLLALYQALLKIGIKELTGKPPDDTLQNDLAQRITAPFRRTLPALRIAGKWLRANLKYITQYQQTMKEKGRDKDLDGYKRGDNKFVSEFSIHGLSQMWDIYARFSNVLSGSFPVQKLPPLSRPLPEDIDMRGFLPLRKLMKMESSKLETSTEKPHPNEDQLMRIADLIEDAKVLAEMENSPVVLRNDRFSVRGSELILPPAFVPRLSQRRDTVTRKPMVIQKAPSFTEQDEFPDTPPSRDDEDAMTEVSRTTDDPVNDAFRAVLDGEQDEDEEQEDEIVWNPRPPLSPIATTVPSTMSSPPGRSPISPTGSSFSPRGAPISPPKIKGQSLFLPPIVSTPAAPAITAQDLLNNIKSPRSTNGGNTGRLEAPQETSAPQSQFLFWSENSIWSDHSNRSTSLDNNAPNLQKMATTSRAGHLRSQSQHFPLSPQQGSSQQLWPPNSSQNSQSFLGNTFPSTSYSPQAYPILNASVSSSVVPSSQVDPQHYNAPGFTQPVQQFPQRPDHYNSTPSTFMNHAMDGAFTDAAFFSGTRHDYHSRHIYPQHNRAMTQNLVPPTGSQTWGNGR